MLKYKDDKFLCDECMNYVNKGEDLCSRCISKKDLYHIYEYGYMEYYVKIPAPQAKFHLF